MSSDDQDRPRRTLSVNKTTRPAEDDAPRRKRSGARARQATQLERSRDKEDRLQRAQSLPAQPRPEPRRYMDREMRDTRRDEPAQPATGAAWDDLPADSAAWDDLPPDAPQWDDDEAPARDHAGHDDAGQDVPVHVAPRGRQRDRHAHGRNQPAEIFQIFAPCPQGLEEALTAEMQALGFEDAKMGRAGCSFSADWSGVQRANLYSRLATRILAQVAQAEISHEDDILDLAYSVPWERWFGAEQTLRVDTSAIKSPVRSLQYCNLRAKDGICDRLRDREGARPDIDTVRPDARVHLFLFGTTATLYLDTTGESLFKRGWRLDKGEAPLRENLAAGMLALAGWDPAAPLLDPFCGSGTILIEAAWIALGVPAGVSRPFGFERLRGFDPRRWRDLKDDARARILTKLETPLVGYDLDPQAIDFARANAERAWLTDETIRFETGDARDIEPPAESGWIVTNPPYGERMEEHDDTLWRDWSACLKRRFAGWQLHVISSDMTLPQRLRLKPQRRIPLHNGALDCRLFGFELAAGSYRDAT
ncbi:THUMP domain-containing protein [Bordetella genomosp. 13]|uniref:THUMP domain-containing protein n=1 Tax=Bordetella genomosp. 13 TaxID=463040 RepID=UPI0011A719A6|nr:THUMP domain-containing protein [Bordetella genomosp. 13]